MFEQLGPENYHDCKPQQTKQIITKRITPEKSDKMYETYLLFLNPHSLRQIEVPDGQNSKLITSLQNVQPILKLIYTHKL